jgi:hypothetical protein
MEADTNLFEVQSDSLCKRQKHFILKRIREITVSEVWKSWSENKFGINIFWVSPFKSYYNISDLNALL